MDQILKTAKVEKQELDDSELALINGHALRPLTADEVFIFRLAACDNQVDRDYERFTDATLDGLAPMFVGKTVLMDHVWSAQFQTARVYAAQVEDVVDGVRRLVLRCYMPRTDQSADVIARLESGILKECSVGVLVDRAVCSSCGADQAITCCEHIPGREYDGKLCVMELDGAKDAYEVSLVAVPAQPAAGVVKSKRYGGQEPQKTQEPGPEPPAHEPATMLERLAAMMKNPPVTA